MYYKYAIYTMGGIYQSVILYNIYLMIQSDNTKNKCLK